MNLMTIWGDSGTQKAQVHYELIYVCLEHGPTKFIALEAVL